MQQLDLTRFLLYRAVAHAAAPDGADADRFALLTSMMDLGLAQGAVLTAAIAADQAAPTPGSGLTGRLRRRRRSRLGARRALAATAAARVKVPEVGHLVDRAAIERHLAERKLRARIHSEAVAELKAAKVAHQWPAANAEVAEGAEVNVVLLIPQERAAPPGKRD